MCLAIVSVRSVPGFPVFVANNRDEFYARQSSGPLAEKHKGVQVLAPRDLRAGGTWIGVNEHAIFAMVTNRSDLETPTASPRSRGLLVHDVLATADLQSAMASLGPWETEGLAPFNLVLGTPDETYLISNDGKQEWSVQEWEPGHHVVSDRGAADDDSVPVVAEATERWNRSLTSAGSAWAAAYEVLHYEGDGPEDPAAICRRGEDRGTIASTLIGITDTGEQHFLHAEGPPTTSPYLSYSQTGVILER